ncbi:MAG: AgmX/PglI C-terminal domain-containing protein [Myxococcota bacterium]|nr:AgmX/PglI C-terminal domain-containing protein [Myxococcota bacterium]
MTPLLPLILALQPLSVPDPLLPLYQASPFARELVVQASECGSQQGSLRLEQDALGHARIVSFTVQDSAAHACLSALKSTSEDTLLLTARSRYTWAWDGPPPAPIVVELRPEGIWVDGAQVVPRVDGGVPTEHLVDDAIPELLELLRSQTQRGVEIHARGQDLGSDLNPIVESLRQAERRAATLRVQDQGVLYLSEPRKPPGAPLYLSYMPDRQLYFAMGMPEGEDGPACDPYGPCQLEPAELETAVTWSLAQVGPELRLVYLAEDWPTLAELVALQERLVALGLARPFEFNPSVPILGHLEKEAISGVIQASMGPLADCYQQAVKTDPDLAGQVVVRFRIETDGRVTRQEVKESTLSSPPVEACLLEVVDGLQFPEPKGDGVVWVRYPFSFTPA